MRITTTILLIALAQLLPYILADPQYPANKRINPCITIGANSYYQGDLSKPCATTTYYNDPQGGSCACCTPTASGVCETLPWAGVKRVAAASPLVFGINNEDASACPQCCSTGCGKCFRVTFVDYGPTEHSTCIKSSVDKCQKSLSVMIVNSCFDAHTCPPIGQANPSGFFAHIDLLDMTGFVRQDYGWSNPVVYYERVPCGNVTEGTPTDSEFGQCQATCQDKWGYNCAKSNPSWKAAVPAPPGISATSAPAPAPPKTSATSAPVTSPSNGACPIAMSQTLSSSYSSGGQTVNQYTVVLKNNHATQSLQTTVGFSSSPLSFWSLDAPSSARDLVYGLPDWLNSGIPAGATHEFGFTTPASAPVTVQIVTPCSSTSSSSPSPAPATPTPTRSATSPPTATPSPATPSLATPSPATPSPATLSPATMPPATPSSSLPPSTTPTSCSAIAFSTRKMGSWADETGNVVQYVVTLTNTGPSALPSVIISADAASRASILSLYSLTATGTSWTIPAYALPLPPASSLTFGYIGHNPLPLVFQATC